MSSDMRDIAAALSRSRHPERPQMRIPTTWNVLAHSILTELHTGPVTRAEESAHALASLIIDAGEQHVG